MSEAPITLELASHPDGIVPLGGVCQFALRGAPGGVEALYYLTQNRVVLPRALGEGTGDSLSLFPEAPGDYVLTARWRSPEGGSGRATARFEVVAGPRKAAGPRLVDVDRKTRLWLTSEWESALAAHHEDEVLAAVSRMVRPGDVVYDIGANVGLFSLRFARLVGPSGFVYCVEANPVCVYFLGANLLASAFSNFEIFPVAVSDRAGTAEFSVNYGNTHLGMLKTALPATKPGHRIVVETVTLDALVEEFGLRPPSLIKMDIEGAEIAAAPGMLRTLERHRPILVLELHGAAVARATLAHLAPAGYRYRDVASGRTFATARELGDAFPEACLQVIGEPG
jgi:FkbM family methyltransferase